MKQRKSANWRNCTMQQNRRQTTGKESSTQIPSIQWNSKAKNQIQIHSLSNCVHIHCLIPYTCPAIDFPKQIFVTATVDVVRRLCLCVWVSDACTYEPNVRKRHCTEREEERERERDRDEEDSILLYFIWFRISITLFSGDADDDNKLLLQFSMVVWEHPV